MASSAEGLTKKDLTHIKSKEEGNLSGSERSILEDYKSLDEQVSSVETKLSDEEAGYDQDLYNELRDSASFDPTPEEQKRMDLIEQNPIESWSQDDIKFMEAITGLTYDEMKENEVTKPDGLSVSELMGANDE